MNQERMPLRQSQRDNILTKDVAQEIRMGFVHKVYAILSMQILLTVAVAACVMSLGQLWIQQNAWVLYLSVGSTVALMCIMICCNDQLRTYPQNYIFLFLFTACEGALVGVVSAGFTLESVLVSAGITVLIFLSMTAYAFFTETDFTGLGPYIFAALMTMMLFGFAMMILRMVGVYFAPLEMAYNIMGVLLFTFFIVFDTQRILGEWGGHKVQFQVDDYCFGALTLYLDIINLFLHLLQIFGRRR